MNGLLKLTVSVEKKIKRLLPDVFALVFDGWSLHGTHFLTVFATWPDHNKEGGYSRAMLSFSPLIDEEHLDADSHKDFSNVACIIGDNCATNLSMARKTRLHFVGCASHRFNLGIKIILSTYSNVIDCIVGFMNSLRTLKGRAFLRKHSSLSPVTCNVTRWSSTKAMIVRYFKLLGVEAVSFFVPAELQLSPAENRSASQLLKVLEDLDALTKIFQDEELHLFLVREFLDAAIKQYPELDQHCSARSDIVEDQHFESAVVKIQRCQTQGDVALVLTTAESQSVSHLLKRQYNEAINDSQENEDGSNTDNAETISELHAAIQRIKKRKIVQQSEAEKYLDLRFIRPTSNICERQFSISGLAYTKNRQGLLPVNLEMQLFLKANSHLWDAAVFHCQKE
jgi:hypothetical protein